MGTCYAKIILVSVRFRRSRQAEFWSTPKLWISASGLLIPLVHFGASPGIWTAYVYTSVHWKNMHTISTYFHAHTSARSSASCTLSLSSEPGSLGVELWQLDARPQVQISVGFTKRKRRTRRGACRPGGHDAIGKHGYHRWFAPSC